MGKVFKSFKYPLLVLRYFGLYSGSKYWNTKTIGVIYMALAIFNIWILLMQCPYIKDNMFEVVTVLEAAGILGQHLGKIAVLLVHRIAFSNLIKHIGQCWKTNQRGLELNKNLDWIINYNLTLQRLFFVITVVCVVIFIATSPFSHTLPIGIWKMQGRDVLYAVAFTLQAIDVPAFAIIVISFDCIFLTCCIEIIVQCRLLKQCMKELDMSLVTDEQSQAEYLTEMQLYINHHRFILRFLKAVQTFYSPVVLVEYCTISPIICSEMYATMDRMDVTTFLSCGPLFIEAVMQLAFYSIPVDYVASEVLQVSFALYESNWYVRYFPKLHKPIIVVIQRSNQRVVFTAGGLFEVNSRSLLTVLKISWSACTILRAVKQSH